MDNEQLDREIANLERDLRKLRRFPWLSKAPETRRMASEIEVTLEVFRATKELMAPE